MDSTQKLKEKLNYQAVYSSLVAGLRVNGHAEATGLCPLHDDHHQSFSVNLDNGLWNCHAGCGGGNVFKLYLRKTGATFAIAKREIERLSGLPVQATARQEKKADNLSPGDIQKEYEICKKLLQKKPEWLMRLAEIRNFKEKLKAVKLMTQHGVAIDKWGNFIFPLFDAKGELTGLQRFNNDGVIIAKDDRGEAERLETKSAMMRGHQVGLFGLKKILEGSIIKTVIVCESPIKALHLELQVFDGSGDTAVLGVAGAGNLPARQAQAFKGKDVFFCYDFDFKKNNPGQAGVLGDAKKLKDVAATIKNIVPDSAIIDRFREKGFVKVDLADDFWLEGGAVSEFKKFLNEAQPVFNKKKTKEVEGKPTAAIDYEAAYGNIPTLDREVFTGPFKDYVDLLARSTEAPGEYHYYFFMTVLGLVIGKRAHVFYGRKLYPNFYVVLIGRSGKARKTTAMRFAKDLLFEINEEIMVITGVPSGESIVRILDKKNKIALVYQEEFSVILKKASQEANCVIPRLTEIYDVPDKIENPTKDAPACAENFLLSFVAGSTREWLLSSLNVKDIHGGFANRFAFVVGKPKPPIPLPVRYDQTRWDSLVEKILAIDTTLKFDGNHCFELDDEAKKLWCEYYAQTYNKIWPSAEMSLLAERLPEKVFKVALVYAVLDNKKNISVENLRLAVKVGDHLEKCIEYLFSSVGVSESVKDEQKILNIIKEQGEVGQSDLSQHFGSSMPTEKLKRIIDNLVAMQRIEVFVPQTSRRKRFLRAL